MAIGKDKLEDETEAEDRVEAQETIDESKGKDEVCFKGLLLIELKGASTDWDFPLRERQSSKSRFAFDSTNVKLSLFECHASKWISRCLVKYTTVSAESQHALHNQTYFYTWLFLLSWWRLNCRGYQLNLRTKFTKNKAQLLHNLCTTYKKHTTGVSSINEQVKRKHLHAIAMETALVDSVIIFRLEINNYWLLLLWETTLILITNFNTNNLNQLLAQKNCLLLEKNKSTRSKKASQDKKHLFLVLNHILFLKIKHESRFFLIGSIFKFSEWEELPSIFLSNHNLYHPRNSHNMELSFHLRYNSMHSTMIGDHLWCYCTDFSIDSVVILLNFAYIKPGDTSLNITMSSSARLINGRYITTQHKNIIKTIIIEP
ncbi:hypothetical protein VP01_302g1 [Puccinia sorghi]|uniref:Uncharacterized protein n=1 Tax=Puccinia sorghi TaxID=27349 RepID=A0A0L6V018_9BASI|nr:hypothetical protein VP01_302g1 [Puccinia sorghi]